MDTGVKYMSVKLDLGLRDFCGSGGRVSSAMVTPEASL